MSAKKLLVVAMLVVGCSNTSGESAAPTEPVTHAPENDGGADDMRDASANEADASDAGSHDDAEAGTKADAGPDAGGTCATRKGGAFITFDIGDETLTIWSTNTKFNQDAFLATAQGTAVKPVFGKLLGGFDCDGQWTWHVDPDALTFGDVADPSCQGLPSTIEANKSHWIDTVGRYCPAKARASSAQFVP